MCVTWWALGLTILSYRLVVVAGLALAESVAQAESWGIKIVYLGPWGREERQGRFWEFGVYFCYAL